MVRVVIEVAVVMGAVAMVRSDGGSSGDGDSVCGSSGNGRGDDGKSDAGRAIQSASETKERGDGDDQEKGQGQKCKKDEKVQHAVEANASIDLEKTEKATKDKSKEKTIIF